MVFYPKEKITDPIKLFDTYQLHDAKTEHDCRCLTCDDYRQSKILPGSFVRAACHDWSTREEGMLTTGACWLLGCSSLSLYPPTSQLPAGVNMLVIGDHPKGSRFVIVLCDREFKVTLKGLLVCVNIL